MSSRGCLSLQEAHSISQQFDADLTRRAQLLDATSAGTAVFELEIGEEYSNAAGIRLLIYGLKSIPELTVIAMKRDPSWWCCRNDNGYEIVADDASPEVLESMEDDPNIHEEEC